MQEPYLRSIMQRYSVLRVVFVTDAGGWAVGFTYEDAAVGALLAQRF